MRSIFGARLSFFVAAAVPSPVNERRHQFTTVPRVHRRAPGHAGAFGAISHKRNHVMMRCCCFLLLRDMTRAARGHLVLAARMLRSPDVIADMLARMCKYVANLNKIHSR